MKLSIVSLRAASWPKDIWVPVADEPYGTLGSFINCEIGFSATECQRLVEMAMNTMQTGEPYTEGGNIHMIHVTSQWVCIANLAYDEDEESQSIVISIEAFISALLFWKTRCSRWTRSNPPPEDSRVFVFEDPRPFPDLSPVEAMQECQKITGE